MIKLIQLLFTLFFVGVSYSSADDPTPASLKLFLQHRLVQTIQHAAYPIVINAFKDIPIPDQNVGAIGINIALTSIHLRNVTFDEKNLQISFVPPYNVVINLLSLNAVATMNWRYTDGPLIDWKGTAEDYVNDISATISLGVKTDGQGHFLMSVVDDKLSIGSLNIVLHGDGESVFGTIANLIAPLMKNIVASTLSSSLSSLLNPVLSKLSSLPNEINSIGGSNIDLSFPLDETKIFHGLAGTYYSNNHFSGDASAYSLSDALMGKISINNYQSFDISGYLHIPQDGTYALEILYTQRGQLDFNGVSIGSLETWNIGMCWPENSQAITQTMVLSASTSYPLRLRYQSGCGGGNIELRLCSASDSSSCYSLSPLSLSTSPIINEDVPVLLTNSYMLLAFAAEFHNHTHTPNNNIDHHSLSNIGDVNDGMISLSIDEYVINSLFESLITDNLLSHSFRDSDIPANFPIHLNTSSFDSIIPGLNKLYPNKAMQFDIQADNDNLINILFMDTIGVQLTAPLIFTLSVIDSNNTNTSIIIKEDNVYESDSSMMIKLGDNAYPINNNTDLISLVTFKLNIVGSLKVNIEPNPLSASSQSLYISIGLLNITVNEIVNPSISVPNVTELAPLIDDLFNKIITPYINDQLKDGIPLPFLYNNLALVNTSLVLDKHSISIATDFDTLTPLPTTSAPSPSPSPSATPSPTTNPSPSTSVPSTSAPSSVPTTINPLPTTPVIKPTQSGSFRSSQADTVQLIFVMSLTYLLLLFKA